MPALRSDLSMSDDENAEFGAAERCKEMCLVRVCDDEAKIEGLEARDLGSWKPVLFIEVGRTDSTASHAERYATIFSQNRSLDPETN